MKAVTRSRAQRRHAPALVNCWACFELFWKGGGIHLLNVAEQSKWRRSCRNCTCLAIEDDVDFVDCGWPSLITAQSVGVVHYYQIGFVFIFLVSVAVFRVLEIVKLEVVVLCSEEVPAFFDSHNRAAFALTPW
jgi:hypothetical protein